MRRLHVEDAAAIGEQHLEDRAIKHIKSDVSSNNVQKGAHKKEIFLFFVFESAVLYLFHNIHAVKTRCCTLQKKIQRKKRHVALTRKIPILYV